MHEQPEIRHSETITTPCAREIHHWQKIAHRRIRLAYAMFFIGLLAGILLHTFMAMPPIWIDQLP